jgi:predicted N-formylglutamate amidohydrolase
MPARIKVQTPDDALDPPLLGDDDAPPFRIRNPAGASPLLFICDHAANAVPRRLGALGLSALDRDRHIAWDLGIAGVAERLADALDAFLILQSYSRLVIDCNRPPGSPQSIVDRSDGAAIPANRDLGPREVERRVRAIFDPYHGRIRAELDARAARRRPTLLVALHSFTPALEGGAPRPWHIGVFYNRDARLAHALRDRLRREADLVIGDNQPYAASDATDYAIPVHGERRGLPHAGLEIRQDTIHDERAQRAVAERLAPTFVDAVQALLATGAPVP